MKDRFSKEEWLERSLKVLIQDGFGLVKIDKLVAQMGVTKGSFYWHFNDRDAYIQELVTYWDGQHTRSVMEYVNQLSGHPRDRLFLLLSFVIENQLARYDDVFHALAQSEPSVTKSIRKINKIRIEFVASLFLDMGFSALEAEVRSQMMVVYMTYEQSKSSKHSVARQLELVTEAHRMVTGLIEERA